MEAQTDVVLEVNDLQTYFYTRLGIVKAVDGVSFNVRAGETLGIVGESGCGKTMTARSLLRLVPKPAARIVNGEILLKGEDLVQKTEDEMRSIRGRRISMIMQDPRYSLNPVMTVGWQIAEAYRVHTNASKKEAKDRALDMLKTVRIREPQKVYGLYPHQVSGGMGQRIMIAMMLIPGPDLIIADEPTSALDVTVQLQILAILDDMVRDGGMGLILISHDLQLVSSFCDRIVVMYGGQIMEVLDSGTLDQAKHPYTRGMLNCLPDIDKQQEILPVLQRDGAWQIPRGRSV